MIEDTHLAIHSLYTILGLAGIVGGLKAVDWLISIKYATKDDVNKRINKLYDALEENKDFVSAKLETQYKEILSKIDAQNKIFAEIASQIAEISAENKIILKKLGLD